MKITKYFNETKTQRKKRYKLYKQHLYNLKTNKEKLDYLLYLYTNEVNNIRSFPSIFGGNIDEYFTIFKKVDKKKCSNINCKSTELLSFTCFGIDKSSGDGYTSWCLECRTSKANKNKQIYTINKQKKLNDLLSKENIEDYVKQIYNESKSSNAFINHFTNTKTKIVIIDKIVERTKYLNKDISIGERLYHIVNDFTNLIKCPICKINICKFNRFNEGYFKYCSLKCSNSSTIVQKKKEETLLTNYGVTNPNKSKEIKKKITETNLERYGTESPTQNKDIKQKIVDTNLERYGFTSAMKNEEVKQKVSLTQLKNNFKFIISSKRIGDEFECLTQIEDYQAIKYNKLMFKHKNCGHEFTYSIANGIRPRCPKCNPPQYTSNGEIEVREFCNQYFNNIDYSTRDIINPFELDIYIPKINLAIEYNGLYWHSEKLGKDKNYHLNKTKICNENGIQLIHIFEDEWIDQQDIIESILLNKFGKIKKTNRIFARKCEIGEVNNIDAKRFMFDNHLQGFINGTHYGLAYKNKLISMITVGKSRFDKTNSLELYRFCSLLNHQVVGGLSRLVKYVERNLKPKNIVTYADLRFGTGKGYLSAGFKFDHVSKPNYFYIKNGKRYSRIACQKHKLNVLLKDFDNTLTESQNMYNNNYYKVWDCGNIVFRKEL